MASDTHELGFRLSDTSKMEQLMTGFVLGLLNLQSSRMAHRVPYDKQVDKSLIHSEINLVLLTLTVLLHLLLYTLILFGIWLLLENKMHRL